MILKSCEEAVRNIARFNEEQMGVKRDRSYVPVVIDETIDTTSQEWLLYCLVLHYVNLPFARDRKYGLEKLNKENPALYETITPRITAIESEHFGLLVNE